MFTDSGLENCIWVPEVGNGIGSPGTPNPVITIAKPTPAAPWLTVSTGGGSYADGLAKCVRPLLVSPANDGAFTFAYDIMTDARTPSAAQALETTPRVVLADGSDLPGDFQNNYEEGGMIQIWQSKANPWADTGIKIGKYTPGQWYSVAINYTFDIASHTMSIPSFSINGKAYAIPAAMQHVAMGTGLGWPINNFYHQLQLDANKGGGAFSVSYRNIVITYPGT
jgi:hypothetical protein